MDNLKTVEGIYKNIAQENYPAVLAKLDVSVEWHEAAYSPYKGKYKGPEQVLTSVFQRLKKEWDSYAISIDQLVNGGETIVMLGEFVGYNKQEEKAYKESIVHVWDFYEGKVIKIRQFADKS